jgi:hypothetical protein
MIHLTNAVLADSVQAMQPVFDSHALICDLMSRYPQEYVRELHARVHLADPIKATHADIGQALLSVPGIAPTRKVDSLNVRGRVSENQEWRKGGAIAGV